MFYLFKSFFRITLLLILITIIPLLCAVALSFNVENIQPIGYCVVLSSLPLLKPRDGLVSRRLTESEKLQFTLSPQLKDILVGLILGDLNVNNRRLGKNPCLRFRQGAVHEDYLLHLYELFKEFCPSGPKTQTSMLKVTGKGYKAIYFGTYALPCFGEFLDIFYQDGIKVVPANIANLLTPSGLAYWICDDGGFNKKNRAVVLSTQSFTLEGVELLVKTLNDKFNLNCTINKNGNNFVIRISSKSLSLLQDLLTPHMPNMMRHKIGL